VTATLNTCSEYGGREKTGGERDRGRGRGRIPGGDDDDEVVRSWCSADEDDSSRSDPTRTSWKGRGEM